MPGLKKNLLSIDQMLDHNLIVEFDTLDRKKQCLIRDKSKDSQSVARAIGVGRMFLLDIVASNNQAFTVNVSDDTTLWHHRYGHMNLNYLITLQWKKMVNGLPSLTSPTPICSSCIP